CSAETSRKVAYQVNTSRERKSPERFNRSGRVVSEAESQPKLNHARQIVLRRDFTEVWRAETCIRRAKLRMVEEIEKLCSEFEPESIVGTEFGVLESGEINVLDPIATKVWFCTCIRAVPVIVRERERRGIEPSSQLLVLRPGGHFSGTDYCRPRRTRVWNACLTEQTIAAPDGKRKAALQSDDCVHSPAADDFIRNRSEIAREPLALSHR